MAKIKKNLNASLQWDIVECEVVFGNNGIQLNTTNYSGQPDLANALASITKVTLPVAKASLELAATQIKKVPADHRPLTKEGLRKTAITRDWGDLASYVFQPKLNTIQISKSRATHLIFYSRSVDWKFDPPGLFLDSPLDPVIGTLAAPEIIDNEQTVRTTFVPGNLVVPAQFKYNLRLIASASNFGASAGHVIIIVDPIIEKSKQ